jgi:hypothetical protein
MYWDGCFAEKRIGLGITAASKAAWPLVSLSGVFLNQCCYLITVYHF